MTRATETAHTGFWSVVEHAAVLLKKPHMMLIWPT